MGVGCLVVATLPVSRASVRGSGEKKEKASFSTDAY
jgi:hypothetical protein